MKKMPFVMAVVAMTSLAIAGPVRAADAGHVTGIGGVVIASRDPRALAAWYRDVLGMTLQPWGGAMFARETSGHPPYTLWSTFAVGAKEFAHARHGLVVTLAVDDLDALCRRLASKHVAIFERQSGPYGKFASVIDPDGTKLELWQAPPKH